VTTPGAAEHHHRDGPHLAVNESVCVRPVLRRVTDRATGTTTTVAIPCGSTRESRCPTCAKKARWLRMTQCAGGWHRDDEPEEPEDVDLEETAEQDEDLDDDQGNGEEDSDEGERWVRSTRRRQDVSELPRVPVANDTIDRTFTAPSGVKYRPSMLSPSTSEVGGHVMFGTPKTHKRRSVPFPAFLTDPTDGGHRWQGRR
jgi:hypothetical protein